MLTTIDTLSVPLGTKWGLCNVQVKRLSYKKHTIGSITERILDDQNEWSTWISWQSDMWEINSAKLPDYSWAYLRWEQTTQHYHIANLVFQGKKIQAIKLARQIYGMGLREAKMWVETNYNC